MASSSGVEWRESDAQHDTGFDHLGSLGSGWFSVPLMPEWAGLKGL